MRGCTTINRRQKQLGSLSDEIPTGISPFSTRVKARPNSDEDLPLLLLLYREGRPPLPRFLLLAEPPERRGEEPRATEALSERGGDRDREREQWEKREPPIPNPTTLKFIKI
jgi:hypothetical protein